MKQQTFEQLYAQSWQQLEEILTAAEDKSLLRLKEVKTDPQLPALYRRICHHLSLAQERRYSSYLIERLNQLVLRGHQQLYRRQTRFIEQMVRFVIFTFPNRVRENIGYFWLANGLFYGPTLIVFLLVLFKPELVYSFMDSQQIYQFEQMYDPSAERFGEDRGSNSDFQMFGYYIQNNISVGFQTFATGIAFGLGSLFYLIFNGLFFGAVAGHIVNISYENTFFPFVIGHGSFELTAITIAGAGGLMLGHAILQPGNYTRQASLKMAASKALDLLYGVIIMLVLAAFFEAYWSSNSSLSLTVKYGVGTLLWLFVIGYFCFAGKAPKNKTPSIKAQR